MKTEIEETSLKEYSIATVMYNSWFNATCKNENVQKAENIFGKQKITTREKQQKRKTRNGNVSECVSVR